MRPGVALFILASTISCRRGTRAAVDAATTADVAVPIASAAPIASASTADPRAARDALGEIGFGTALVPTPKGALQANDVGYARHLKGDFAGSKAGFADAVARAPEFVLARYNLACALARLGELRAARVELERVLAADLVTFRDRIDTDADLAPLRASSEMTALRSRIEVLQAAFSLAWGEGVESLAWHGFVDSNHVETTLLRVGVYLGELRRFVPLAPEVAGVAAAAIDRQRARALLMKAIVEPCGGGICPRLEPHVDVFVAALDPSSLASRAPMAHGSFVDPVGGPVVAATAYTTKDGARFCVDDPGLGASAHQCKAIEGTSDEARVSLYFGGSGATVTTPSAIGFSVAKGALTLPDGRVVALSKDHAGAAGHAIVVSRDGQRAVVVSNVDLCECQPSYHSEFRYAISGVDLSSAIADPMAHGPQNALALFGPNGDLFVQIGARVVRHAGGLGAGADVLEGVVLGIPHAASTGCCGA